RPAVAVFFRELETLVADGFIVKSSRIEPSINAMNARGGRLISILRALPEADYATLKANNPWIVAPLPGVMGWNGPVPAGKTQVIYLPESLEREPAADVRLTIAHEIAHCLLGHTRLPADDPANETAAWHKAIDLGFGTVEAVSAFRKKHGV